LGNVVGFQLTATDHGGDEIDLVATAIAEFGRGQAGLALDRTSQVQFVGHEGLHDTVTPAPARR
jgi:hypothetical protein